MEDSLVDRLLLLLLLLVFCIFFSFSFSILPSASRNQSGIFPRFALVLLRLLGILGIGAVDTTK